VQCCRGLLRDNFQSDDDIQLVKREKRAHCYPLSLLDDVLLGSPPLPCHKTCLAGLRALIRLLNKAALSDTDLVYRGLSLGVQRGGSGGSAGNQTLDGMTDDHGCDSSRTEAPPRGGSAGTAASDKSVHRDKSVRRVTEADVFVLQPAPPAAPPAMRPTHRRRVHSEAILPDVKAARSLPGDAPPILRTPALASTMQARPAAAAPGASASFGGANLKKRKPTWERCPPIFGKDAGTESSPLKRGMTEPPGSMSATCPWGAFLDASPSSFFPHIETPRVETGVLTRRDVCVVVYVCLCVCW
jgi:hypothetical protein